jgi:hypothetical protein
MIANDGLGSQMAGNDGMQGRPCALVEKTSGVFCNVMDSGLLRLSSTSHDIYYGNLTSYM